MIGDDKEVYFDKYCPTCKYLDEDEDDPESHCAACLDSPANQDSHKPINWEEKK